MSKTLMFKALMNHATINGSKTSVLAPLQWMIGLTVIGIILNACFKNNFMVYVFLFSITTILSGVFLFYFIFFAHRNPDMLRSEKYSLSKMAIERGLIGDSITGLIDPNEKENHVTPLLPNENGDGK